MSHKTTERDVRCWYSYDWANSPFSQVCIGTFAPLLLDSYANLYAYSSSNIVQPPSCKMVNNSYVYPTNNNVTGCIRCLEGSGDQVYYSSTHHENPPVTYVLGGLRPSAFALVIVAISVFIQAFCFVSLGAMADYSNRRYNMLLVSAFLGAGVTMLFAVLPTGLTGDAITGATILVIVTNVLFGISTIFYNAFLPYLTACHPTILAAKADPGMTPAEVLKVEETLQSRTSNVGYMWGYTSGVIVLILGAGVLAMAGAFAEDATEIDAQTGYKWACALAGLWWFVFSFGVMWIHPWPGKPLPEGVSSYVLFSWKQTFDTVREAKKLPHTFRYLVLYFFFSDGLSTTGTVGLLFAKRDMCAGVISQFIVALLVPIFALMGNYVFVFIHDRWSLTSLQSLRLTLWIYLLLPIWGLVGYIPSSPIGFRKIWELYFIGVWYGTILGAAQAYARAVFADLTPTGREAQFFSLYAITDKGSSWIGPLLVGMLTQTGLDGVMRVAFFYLLVVIAVPCVLLGYVDVEAGKAAARDVVVMVNETPTTIPLPVSTLEAALTAYFTVVDPSRLPSVHSVAATYEGFEADAFIDLERKYGITQSQAMKKSNVVGPLERELIEYFTMVRPSNLWCVPEVMRQYQGTDSVSIFRDLEEQYGVPRGGPRRNPLNVPFLGQSLFLELESEMKKVEGAGWQKVVL